MDFLCDLLYDKITEGLEPDQQSKLDELLNVPLGVHPDQTKEAKAQRAAMLGGIMNEQGGGPNG